MDTLALAYFKFNKFYKALLDEGFCSGLFAFCTRLLIEEMQNFDSYRTKLENAVSTFLGEVKSAATAANSTPRDVFKTQVSIPISKKGSDHSMLHRRG